MKEMQNKKKIEITIFQEVTDSKHNQCMLEKMGILAPKRNSSSTSLHYSKCDGTSSLAKHRCDFASNPLIVQHADTTQGRRAS